jgi:hypothetical protein
MKKLFVLLAAMLTFTSTAFAQIGSLASDLVYTPVTPCRIFDTRPAFGGTGPIPAAGTKNFFIWGVVSYASQGGAASNCGITAGVNTAAVAVNFTVVSPATPGYITAFPFGTVQPTAATVNFNAGDVRGNFSIAKNAQSGASDLSIFSTSNVDVVGDVVGYYSKPVATALDCTTVAGVSTTLPASSTNTSAPAPACASGYTRVGVLCGTSTNSNRILGTTLSACFSANDSALAATVTTSSVCCRIPGR